MMSSTLPDIRAALRRDLLPSDFMMNGPGPTNVGERGFLRGSL